MNPFLRYLADKNSAHTHTQADRHTPLTTRPDGLRRAGKNKRMCRLKFCKVLLHMRTEDAIPGNVVALDSLSYLERLKCC